MRISFRNCIVFSWLSWVEENDALGRDEGKGCNRRNFFCVTIAVKKVAAVAMMIISGPLAIRGEDRLAFDLRQVVNLLIGHQQFGAAFRALAHVIGVADAPLLERFAFRNRFVLAAGTNERLGRCRVLRYELRERRL